MTASVYPSLLALGERRRYPMSRPTRWTLATSLGLHLMLLAVAFMIRLPHIAERPAASYQVSLVTLQPVAKPVVLAAPEPSLQPVTKPVPSTVTAPPKPVTEAPKSVPKSVTVAKLPPLPATRKPSETGQNLMKDVLRGIELPPEAPRLTETQVAAPPTPERPTRKAREIESMIGKLTIPDLSPKAPAVPMPAAPPEPMTRQSVLEELEKLERQLQAVEVPPPVPMQPSPAKPAESALLPPPTTSMRIDGIVAGSNSYFSRVQGLVSRHWAPPKVDLGGREPKVVVRFRLHRSGAVSDLSIERSSGNEYYDAAGKRAVLSAAAAQLPPFPTGLTQAYVEVNFSFGVEPNPGS